MPVHALAHITGGGLTDNIPRVLPAGLEAVLERAQLAARSGIRLAAAASRASTPAEMYRTFNCGIGMVVDRAGASARRGGRVPQRRAARRAQVIGEVRAGGRGVVINE